MMTSQLKNSTGGKPKRTKWLSLMWEVEKTYYVQTIFFKVNLPRKNINKTL